MSGKDGRLYRTKRWAQCRAIQLGKQPICEGCEAAPAEHVDHVVPVSAGGDMWKSSNWQSLCPPCHSEKTACDKTGRRWLPARHRGVFEDGSPRDPSHPWFKGPPAPGEGAFDHEICALANRSPPSGQN